MSTFLPNKHVKGANPLRDYNKSYSWKKLLQSYERSGFKNTYFLPVQAMSTNLMKTFSDIVKEDILFELKIDDYEKNTERVEVRWFARVIKICGYRALARYHGFKDNSHDFWINMVSNDVKSVGNCASSDPDQTTIVYAPPLALSEEHKHDMEKFLNDVFEELRKRKCLTENYDDSKKKLFRNKFEIGQRLELLNYNEAKIVRVAKIKNICGRRLNVLVSKQDYDGDWDEDDRQLNHGDAGYWIDQDSFFIFPVGWASLNGFITDAKTDYKKHAAAIAKSIENNEQPIYDKRDVTADFFKRPAFKPEDFAKIKIGQKFELLDPLAQQFQELNVASVLKILPTPGYLVVTMDGPDAEEDSVPLYIVSPFIFPVGYAQKHGLTLKHNSEVVEDWDWDSYLKTTQSEPLPIELFKPEPDEKALKVYKVGAKVEAADMCENQFICPASIKSVHGRLLYVNFDGWEEEYDELYDIESHDIFPVGWCEIHGYTLQEPKT